MRVWRAEEGEWEEKRQGKREAKGESQKGSFTFIDLATTSCAWPSAFLDLNVPITIVRKRGGHDYLVDNGVKTDCTKAVYGSVDPFRT